ARDDDLVPDRQALEYFHFGDALGTEPYRPSFGDVALHDVGEAAALLVDEGTAVDHQHVVAPVDEDADREPLTLTQPGRLFLAEAQASGHLPGHNLRRDPAHGSGPTVTAAFEIGLHAGS